MSSIAFNSPSGTVYVSGRERAGMSVMCSDMLKAQLGSMNSSDEDLLRFILPRGHYLLSSLDRMVAGEIGSGLHFKRDFEVFLNVGDDPLFIDGEPYELFSLQLNSAVSWGNRAMQLAAKLHGQCEIHAYCEAANRSWLADVIAEGLESRVFRNEAVGYDGWTKVINFLRSNAVEPVVTSYSVCDSFPGPHCAPSSMNFGDDPWEAWSQLSDEEAWRVGMEHVRADPSLEISPERLGRRFGHTLSGKEFMDLARAKLAEAAATVPQTVSTASL